MNRVDVYDLGHMPYKEAWDLQKHVQKCLIDKKLAARKQTAESNDVMSMRDVLLFVEHPHVYTLGRSGDSAHLLGSRPALDRIGATFVESDRGGDITYHGPGQIVGYPILDLDRYFTDVKRYLRTLEEVVIRVCADYGVNAGRIEGLTGVWVEDRKVCAMGIRCSRWVTMHGFALNVNADLSYFNQIVPCGITDRAVTNLSELVGERLEEADVRKHITHHFGQQFSAEMHQGEDISNYIPTDIFRIMQGG